MNPEKTITLASGVSIGPEQPCFIVAEIGNNHQGDVQVAVEMLRKAAKAGANGVKLQKRHVPSLLTEEGLRAPYNGGNSFGATYGEHRQALELGVEEMALLKQTAEDLGLVFFASAWDSISMRQMIELEVELIKICSADLVNVPLLRQAAESGIPMILSTGMSTMNEIDSAVRMLLGMHDDLVLLHCNSSYPCPEHEICLPVMRTLKERFGLNVGYSGHEKGVGPSVAAVALGARVVERHFTLDRGMRGTDHKASLEPDDFALMTQLIRETEAAMSIGEKQVFPAELATAHKLRKSIVSAMDLKAGAVLGNGDLTTKSPGTGISPVHWDKVRGATLRVDLKKDTLLTWDMLGE